MYRTIQEEKGNKRAAEDKENEQEEKRPRQQFDKDFTLEPFEGVSPEYMEMSESHLVSYSFYALTHSVRQLHNIICILSYYSNPVWVCDSFCGFPSAGTCICFTQQHY